MKFSLIICTYMRPEAILTLLKSVVTQTRYPDEILIIDGSTNGTTEKVLKENSFERLTYFKVDDENRGLTKQRNFGIEKVAADSEVVSFLDDDTVLPSNYFQVLIDTYKNNPNITGVGGIASNENRWELKEELKTYAAKQYFELDGYIIKEGLRNVVRNYLGLQSDQLPHIMPSFSNGRSSYPINNKIYPVDLLIGMSFSFHRKVFSKLKFSTYFEGYGLYEDADYSLRAMKLGQNVINTALLLEHYHDSSGRPNKYLYGKMVIRNGWYVWRLKYPKTTLKAKLKWNTIAIVLSLIRLLNVVTTNKRKEAFTETMGRFAGLLSLIISKPKIER